MYIQSCPELPDNMACPSSIKFNRFYHLLLSLLLSSQFVLADDEPTSNVTQVSIPFVEPITNLTMERFFGARTSFALAMTLPSTPTNSFIGQLSFPLVAGAGWGALGLIGDMENNFILACWPDGAGGVTASFRQASNEDNPPEVTGNFTVRQIAAATQSNDTALTMTFVCEGCLDKALGLGVEQTGGDAVMGWALSEKAVTNPTDPGATLGFHERGFGPFTMRLGQARSAEFEAVAAGAGAPVKASSKASNVQLNIASSGTETGDDEKDEDKTKAGKESDDDDD